MLYELLVPLVKYWSAFNVFRYITFRTAVAAVTALAISFALGPWLIRRLRVAQHGEDTIREDTPARHRAKAGTPTMGGLVILAAILASTLAWSSLRNRYVWVLILATAGLGLIGYLDDRKKLKTRKGISARQKLGAQVVWIGLLMSWLYFWPPEGFSTGLTIPFF
jgi:phospho-N-acetylmuramoyl-pentapeptide-transferase